jgi:hypothetical protein
VDGSFEMIVKNVIIRLNIVNQIVPGSGGKFTLKPKALNTQLLCENSKFILKNFTSGSFQLDAIMKTILSSRDLSSKMCSVAQTQQQNKSNEISQRALKRFEPFMKFFQCNYKK